MLNNNKAVLLILSILVFVSACKPREKIIIANPDRNVDMAALKSTIDNRTEKIQTLRFSKVKFSLKLAEEDYKMGGTIGIIKDSIIVVSIIPLMGYEMARIYCTRDSILVINRIEKSFYKSSLSDELRKYKLSANYSVLQSILMNSYFVYTEATSDRFHANSLVLREGEYLIKSEEKIRNEVVRFYEKKIKPKLPN